MALFWLSDGGWEASARHLPNNQPGPRRVELDDEGPLSTMSPATSELEPSE